MGVFNYTFMRTFTKIYTDEWTDSDIEIQNIKFVTLSFDQDLSTFVLYFYTTKRKNY